MNAQDFKHKLVQPNSGSEVYNKGIMIANSRANKLFKQIFNYFELSISEAKRIYKDNQRLKILFDGKVKDASIKLRDRMKEIMK